MPTPTYTLIEEQVLSSAQASVTLGSGGTIPQTYRDLVVEWVGSTTAGGQDFRIRFNGDTGSNYSNTSLIGNGTTATSTRRSNETAIVCNDTGNNTSIITSSVNIFAYAGTATYKTALIEYASANTSREAAVGLWRSTAAITSITAVILTGSTWTTGTTFRLWGV